jgi:hypothetical protein
MTNTSGASRIIAASRRACSPPVSARRRSIAGCSWISFVM